MDVAAIVVVYRPAAELLRALAKSVMDGGVALHVMDNGGGADALRPMADSALIRIVDMGGNRGIGRALNRGVQRVRDAGARAVILFDQDSSPERGMIRLLLEQYEGLRAAGVHVGAIGPRFVDRRVSPALEHPFPRLRNLLGPAYVRCPEGSEVVESDFLISSGCLIGLDVLADVGPFDESLFVDCTDIDWCFRARARGWRLFGSCRAAMAHELGQGRSRRVLGLTLFEYSALRRYYFARNMVRMVFAQHVEARWKLRMALQVGLRGMLLPLSPRADGAGLASEYAMFLRGLAHGFKRLGGPALEPRKIWPARPRS